MFRSNVPPGFREIREREAWLLGRLLTRRFPGSPELRRQLARVSVAQLDDNGSLRLSTSVPGPAAVVGRIPIEASYADIDGVRVHLLVHVVDGYLDEFEVYREDSSKVRCAPSYQESIDFDAC